ncbi:MAG: molybdopterin-dependent oxidoreductase [Blastochloris sp.]|nr:molybdopterin-dependent oxidoreductase [Blastochloris sp.]
MHRLLGACTALVLVGVGGSACQPASVEIADCDRGCTIVTDGELQPGDLVPAPAAAEDVVLTVTGNITVTNNGDQLDFDLPTLERLGLVEYETQDEGIGIRGVYRGVLLADLLRVAGVDLTTMQYVRARGVDNYEKDLPRTVLQWPVVIATSRDGKRIPFAERGPLEIIFPYDDFSINAAAHDPMWVWWLIHLEVQ